MENLTYAVLYLLRVLNFLESGHNHNGTIKGPVLEFNSTDFISVATPFNWELSNRYVAPLFWVNHDSLSPPDVFYHEEWDTGGNDKIIIKGSSNTGIFEVSVWDADGGNERTYTSNGVWTYTAEVWHAFTVQFDITGNSISIWMDGVQKATDVDLTSLGSLGDVPSLQQWGAEAGPVSGLDGAMRYLGLYSAFVRCID